MLAAPSVTSLDLLAPSQAVTNASHVSFAVEFNQAVTGVDPTDFQLVQTGTVGTTLVQVTHVTGSQYTVTISGITGDGTLGLNLVDDNSIKNLGGEALGPSISAPGDFSEQTNYATGNRPESVASADVNGDGHLDLLVANYSSNNVSVLLGNGNGTFQAKQNFATAAGPTSVTTADVNGDSDLDLVVANLGSGNVGVLLGNGDGTFQAQAAFSATGAFNATAADVNGDGRPDLVAVNYFNDSMSLLLGNGNGTFQAKQDVSTGVDPYSVAIADVNGDGRRDIISANTGSNDVSVLLGNGDGTFQPHAAFAVGSQPRSVTVTDVNGDSRLDLLVANTNSNNVSVLLGNGNGTFQSQVTFATGSRPVAVSVGDIDGDGQKDLVVANSSSNTVGVLLSNGDGTFQPQTTVATGDNPFSVISMDFDNNGFSDIFVANKNDNNATVILNSVKGDFTGSVYTIDPSAIDFAPFVVSIDRSSPAAETTNADSVTFLATFSEDVTGVDPTDFQLALTGTVGTTLVQITPLSGSVYSVAVSGITGAGTLGVMLVSDDSIHDLSGNPLTNPNSPVSFRAQVMFDAGAGARSVTSSDVNGDGLTDLVIANTNDGTVSVLLGNGDGTFQNQIIYATGVFEPNSITAADVNGDGRPDLIVANGDFHNTVTVLLGNGDGTFQSPTLFPVPSIEPKSVIVVDVNGDGQPDLLATGDDFPTGSHVDVLLGNGDGTFKTSTKFVTGDNVGSVAAADVNGDGIPDLIFDITDFNGAETGDASVLLGNGDGTFQSADIFGIFGSSLSVTTADVNADGRPDLLVGSLSSSSGDNVGVLLGKGDGTFHTAVTFLTGDWPGSVTVADVNGDGLPDLFVANKDSDTLSVLLGNGDGTFQTQTTFTTGVEPNSATTADVNGDGRLDLVVANGGSNNISVLLNDSAHDDFTSELYTIDPSAIDVAPFVVSIDRSSPAAETTNADSVTFLATFSEDVTGVDPTDFQLALTGTVGTTLVQVTPSGGTVYSVTVSGITGAGTVGLRLIDDSSIRDLSGNPLTNPNSPASFAAQTNFFAGIQPFSVAAADLNGDGHLDLVTANKGNFPVADGSIGVHLGNGDGTYQPLLTFADGPLMFGDGSFPLSVAVVDVDGDANADILFADSISESVGVLLGIGDGTFQNLTTFATGAGSKPYSLSVADVNGDGQPDILVANAGSHNVGVLLGNGDGTFQNQTTFATGAGSKPYSLAAADVNGDGRPDLLVANAGSNNVGVLLGNGDGTFQNQTTFSALNAPTSLATADVNSDGFPDVIIGNQLSNAVTVLLGNGDGTLDNTSVFPLGVGISPRSVTIADINGDGYPDILVANTNSANVSVLLGNGDGTFQSQITFSTGALSAPQSVVAADVDEDGRPDILVANSGVAFNTVGIRLNSLDFSFTSEVYTIDPTAIDVNPFVMSIDRNLPPDPATSVDNVTFMATFSEDVTGVDPTDFQPVLTGTIEVSLIQVTPISDSVYSVTVSGISGAGTLGLNLVDDNSIRDLTDNSMANPNLPASFAAPTVFATSDASRSLALSDVNLDGRTDLIVASRFGDNVDLLLGNGDGTFQNPVTFAVDAPWSVAAADVDGDGRPDLIVASSNDIVTVLLGNGDGTFQSKQDFTTDAVFPFSVAVADVNGDSRPDLIVSGSITNDVSVSLGNGDGTFQSQTSFPAGDGPGHVTATDVNGDGLPDLVAVNYSDETVSVLLGNGNGTFQDQATFATGSGPFFLENADVNGDGSPDLLVANYGSNNVSVLLGNGDGTFQAQATFASGSGPRSVAVADVNGDGLRDLIVGNNVDNTVSLLLGNGDGTFQTQTTLSSGDLVWVGLAAEDVNGDNRPDILVTTTDFSSSPFYRASVMLNNTDGDFSGQVYTIDTTPPPDTQLPTASLGAGNINSGGGSTHSFTVQYSDNVAVDVSDLDSTDVHVTGPNGFSQNASFTGVDVNNDGTPRTATYAINAPGGSWDVSDNGTFTVSMQANQVSDTSNNNYVLSGSLGGFSVNISSPDTQRPTALINSITPPVAGSSTHSFVVEYTDNVAVDASDLDNTDILVLGPNGFSQAATFVGAVPNSDTSPLSATYRIDAPGGSWDAADNGAYYAHLLADEVSDTSGNTALPEELGDYLLAISDPSSSITLSTIGLYQPDNSLFHLKNSFTPGASDIYFSFGPSGNAGWAPLVGDWDGDGTDTVGFYQPDNSLFHLKNSFTPGASDIYFAFGPIGNAGWTPLVGDWDGDGTDTIGLYQPDNSLFHLKNSFTPGASDIYFSFGPSGNAGWAPLVGDWDGPEAVSPLVYAGVERESKVAAITANEVGPLVDQAAADLEELGLSDSQLELLNQAVFVVTDLPGALLGAASASTVYLDYNAAGVGWFVDSSPEEAEEFKQIGTSTWKAIDPGVLDRIDLLSVVKHELGHVIGLDDLDELADNLMSSRLEAGMRRTM